MKVTVKRKKHRSATYRHPAEDNRWRNVSEKSVVRNNGRAVIRTTVVPRVTRRGA